MYTVHGREADFPFSLRFGHGPILVQINLQYSELLLKDKCREKGGTLRHKTPINR